MARTALEVQHDEIKARNQERRLATMAEAERLRALRRKGGRH